MGLLGDALDQRGSRLTVSNPRNPAYWVERLFGGGVRTATGLTVTPSGAYSQPAIFGPTRMIADDVAGMTVHIFKPDPSRPKASIEDRGNPAWDILNWKPNPEMTALDLRSALTGHAVLRGTGYAEIEFDNAMRVRGLWPLRPDKMRPLRNGKDGIDLPGAAPDELVYVYTLPDGQTKVFNKRLIFALPGFSEDGIIGHAVMVLMREAIALAMAMEKHGATYYGNDATPGIVLKHPGILGEVGEANLRKSWRKNHEGLDNAHRLAILEEGMDIERIGASMTDSEYRATRDFQIEEFGRMLRIPLSKLGTRDGRTDNNVEAESIDYVKALVPWGNRWEQRLRFHGVIPAPSYAKHAYGSLIKGDMKARGEFYHWMRQDGNLSGNDVRALEDLPLSDSPAADELWVPLNMVPASTYDENGLTYAQRVQLSNDMVARGFDPAAARTSLNLPPAEHTGLVPTTVQLDPETTAKLLAGSKTTGGDKE